MGNDPVNAGAVLHRFDGILRRSDGNSMVSNRTTRDILFINSFNTVVMSILLIILASIFCITIVCLESFMTGRSDALEVQKGHIAQLDNIIKQSTLA